MNKRIVWKEEYSVGFKPIDVQHQMLIDILNEVHEATQAQVFARPKMDRLLNLLLLYVETHFEYEEKLMRFAEYPGLREHAMAHRDMELRIKGFSVSYGNDMADRYQIILKILERWLITHILDQDRAYMPALQLALC